LNIRRRSLVVSALVFVGVAGSGLWWSQHTTFRYLSGQTGEFDALFAPPPAADSGITRRELDELLEMQRVRTQAQVTAAQADRKKDLARFYAALGLDPAHPPDLPALHRLTDNAEEDIGPYVRAVKEKYRRLRPYEIEPRLHPCIGDVKGDLSYPSGHATYGYLMGHLLSEVTPARRAALMRRAEEFANQRMICGVHFRSDLEAGRRGAVLLLQQMHTSPGFRRDLAAAQEEFSLAVAPAVGDVRPPVRSARWRRSASRLRRNSRRAACACCHPSSATRRTCAASRAARR
jgi:acid phosphatase (class A)